MEERLQKIIARAGIASRRHAEELISSGLVTVNGQTVTELGSKADESRDHIKVNGKLLRPETSRVYILLHKPPEVVSTMSDPEGRKSLADLLHGVPERVFPVGRLEYHASGLVFLTNDGELANKMLQSHHLPQTYHLKLKTLLTFAEIENLARSTGARIARRKGKEAPWYEVTLAGTRGDALRNRLFQSGHFVERTKRVGLASLELGGLGPGEHRALGPGEVAALGRAIDTKPIPRVAQTGAAKPGARPARPFPGASVGTSAVASSGNSTRRPPFRPRRGERPFARENQKGRPFARDDQKGRPARFQPRSEPGGAPMPGGPPKQGSRERWSRDRFRDKRQGGQAATDSPANSRGNSRDKSRNKSRGNWPGGKNQSGSFDRRSPKHKRGPKSGKPFSPRGRR
jgi:23S rRNA pseudouridine2605 synthase